MLFGNEGGWENAVGLGAVSMLWAAAVWCGHGGGWDFGGSQ